MKMETQTGGLDWADFLAGLGVAAISGAFAYLALHYGLGTLRHVGAGFFSFVLGCAGIALGLFIAARAAFRPTRQHPTPQARSFAFISASVVCFAVAIETAGLLATIVLTTLIRLLRRPRLAPAPDAAARRRSGGGNLAGVRGAAQAAHTRLAKI